MKKLIGRGGRGVSVDVLMNIFKIVARKAMMYGMEVYWDRQKEMKRRLQIWVYRCVRGILGAVKTTPVDALLGERGLKRVEFELDEVVEKKGIRLVRRGFRERFGEERKKEIEEIGSWKLGWEGRIIRRVLRNRLEGEKWDFGTERGGNLNWTMVIKGNRKKGKEKWKREVRKWKLEGMVGVSDASSMNKRIEIRGKVWLYERSYKSGRESRGYELTVAEEEIEGAGRVLNEVRRYEGEVKVLKIGVDKVRVLKALRKSRGMCGKREEKVREWGKELLKKG